MSLNKALDQFLSASRHQQNLYNPMDHGDAGSSNNAPPQVGAGPSNPPPPMSSMGEVSGRIHQLQLKLADCTVQMGRVTTKYDRLLI